jgi:hypothetical protein
MLILIQQAPLQQQLDLAGVGVAVTFKFNAAASSPRSG